MSIRWNVVISVFLEWRRRKGVPDAVRREEKLRRSLSETVRGSCGLSPSEGKCGRGVPQTGGEVAVIVIGRIRTEAPVSFSDGAYLFRKGCGRLGILCCRPDLLSEDFAARVVQDGRSVRRVGSHEAILRSAAFRSVWRRCRAGSSVPDGCPVRQYGPGR